MTKENLFTCSKCSAAWRKNGSTNCWYADPDNKPAKPGNCPTRENEDIIKESFDLYRGDADDARARKIVKEQQIRRICCLQSQPGLYVDHVFLANSVSSCRAKWQESSRLWVNIDGPLSCIRRGCRFGWRGRTLCIVLFRGGLSCPGRSLL